MTLQNFWRSARLTASPAARRRVRPLFETLEGRKEMATTALSGACLATTWEAFHDTHESVSGAVPAVRDVIQVSTNPSHTPRPSGPSDLGFYEPADEVLEHGPKFFARFSLAFASRFRYGLVGL